MEPFALPAVAIPERKVPVVQRPDYTVYLERTSGLTFAHNEVYRWNKSVRRKLAEDWEKLAELHSEPIYVIRGPENRPNFVKFISTFGFRYLMTYEDPEGNLRDLYVHRPQQHTNTGNTL